MSSGLQTVGAVGLDVDLEHLVELVEQVDERGAQIALERVEDVRGKHLQGLRLGPVDVQVDLGAAEAEGGGEASQVRMGISRLDELGCVRCSSARPRLPRSSTIIWKPPVWPRPRIGGGMATKATASWIALSSRLRPETIRSWVSPAPRSFQPLYTTNVVEKFGTLAKSRTERPPMVTQPAMPVGSLEDGVDLVRDLA